MNPAEPQEVLGPRLDHPGFDGDRVITAGVY